MIQINDTYLNQIKAVLAFPDEDALILEDPEICDYAIFPAMMEYFRKFPLEEVYQTPINSELILDFPDEYTFGVLDARVTDVGNLSTGSGTTFWDIVAYQGMVGTTFTAGTGAYSKRGYNPNNILEQRYGMRTKAKSIQNIYATVKTRVDYNNRKVFCFSSVSGMLNVKWAKYSFDFDKVQFQFKRDVVELSQKYLLLHLADQFSILSDTNLEITVNVDALKTRAQEIEEKIKERWEAYPEIVYLHNV